MHILIDNLVINFAKIFFNSMNIYKSIKLKIKKILCKNYNMHYILYV